MGESKKVNLLIITQKVDKEDPILGFFHNWLEKFSDEVKNLYVISLYKGEVDLPDNVTVLSLGKEKGSGKIVQFLKLQKYLVKVLPKVNGIFVHMCPEYVLFAGPLAKLYNKKILLWFVHKSVNWKLWLAEKLVNKIYTSSKNSCRLESKKIEVAGHGVDTDLFKPVDNAEHKKEIICVGRISPIKDQLTFVKAASIIYKKDPSFDYKFKIIGAPYLETDKKYNDKLRDYVRQNDLGERVEFIDKVNYLEMPMLYNESSLLVNLCPTGGMDKVVLEAMAFNLPVIVCNQSFKGCISEGRFFECGSAQDLANKIMSNIGVSQNSRQTILDNFSLERIVKKIVEYYG